MTTHGDVPVHDALRDGDVPRQRPGRDEERSMRSAYKQVKRALDTGATLDDVAEEIEHRPLSRDARDALWLYAWTLVERSQIRAWTRPWRG